MDILEQLRAWYNSQQEVGDNEVVIEFSQLLSGRPKRSASATAVGPSRLARLTVWETGEAELDLADAESGAMDQQHRQITSSVGLSDAVETMMAWVRHV